MENKNLENIYLPTSRKEGGETLEEIEAYLQAFPLKPESESIDFKNYLRNETAVLNVEDEIFNKMAWIKSGVSFVDIVTKRKALAGGEISDEEKNQIHREVTERTRRKMEELKYLIGLIDFPEDCTEIYDVAGGAGDVAIALTLKAYLERLPINKATIVDPVEEFGFFSELIINHMPFGQTLRELVKFRQDTLQNVDFPENAIVVAKHPCGDLADDLIERWLSSDSPELVMMTCCQGKAKNRAPRYSLEKEEWVDLCKKSDWTNSQDPEKRKEGADAMAELDTKRVEYLRGKGVKVDFYTTDKFIKGNVIVAKRY